MNSGVWGLGSPAGVSGSAGRGTVGTDAPTAPKHDYATVGVPFGAGLHFQPRCSCGWLYGVSFRAPRTGAPTEADAADARARAVHAEHAAEVSA